MFKVDLHTHSTASSDGGIKPDQYRRLLDTKQLDYIAITDHDRIDLAQELHQSLGDSIIVGEEITSQAGEIIGLFLTKPVLPGQTAQATAQAIKNQGGLVYIPHPFETVRKGLTVAGLDEIMGFIDIVETHNGRAVWQNRSQQATAWATDHHKAMAASSDAHGLKGLLHTYTLIDQPLSQDNCLTRLTTAKLVAVRPPLTSLLYPKLNRLNHYLKPNKS